MMMFRPSAVTDEMLVQIRAMAGKVPAREIASRLSIRHSVLANRARLYGISLRANRTVSAPAVERQIRSLIGKLSGKQIAAHLGLKYSSLCDWASRRGVALRGQRLVSHTNIYHRLSALARKAGLRLSWPSANSGISLWVSVAEDMTPEEAEAFLEARNGKHRHDVAVVAYDRATNGHDIRSLGAAALCPGGYEALLPLPDGASAKAQRRGRADNVGCASWLT